MFDKNVKYIVLYKLMITRQLIYCVTVRTHIFGKVQVVLCEIQPRPQSGAGVVLVVQSGVVISMHHWLALSTRLRQYSTV